MTPGRGHPWLLSVGLHLLVGGLVALFLFREGPPAVQAVKMRLVGAGASSGGVAAKGPSSWWSPAPVIPEKRSEPSLPAWHDLTPGTLPEAAPVPVPVSLDELLGPQPVSQAPGGDGLKPELSLGWSGGGGEGYAPPPLPPPNLAPPQGASWSLVLFIPGGGGFAKTFEGLDSGYPELDRWLDVYLRTVSFPPSLDGQDYQLRWFLRLETGRPR